MRRRAPPPASSATAVAGSSRTYWRLHERVFLLGIVDQGPQRLVAIMDE